MPEMDGLEASKIILKSPLKTTQKRPTIIAMTANVMEEEKKHCFEIGMDDFLSKPIKIQDIVSVIKKWGNRSV
jgi:CheY-like chemotaxis protein